jgi:hypothetical protein
VETTPLRTDKQRQRQAAALELSLMQPAKPLFETRAIRQKTTAMAFMSVGLVVN